MSKLAHPSTERGQLGQRKILNVPCPGLLVFDIGPLYFPRSCRVTAKSAWPARSIGGLGG